MTRFADFQTEINLAGVAGRTPPLPLTADALELAAAEVMAPEVYSYVAGSAGTESTARENRAAFQKWALVPRHLRGVAEPDLTVELLGTTLRSPILLAPIGALGAVRPKAELEVARAASSLGVPMILSTLSSTSLEEVAAELHRDRGTTDPPIAGGATGIGWFQLYWPADREIAQSLVQRAERAGYQALVVTLDTWKLAWRPRDLANGYLPFQRGHGLANYLTDPVFRSRLPTPPEEDPAAAVQLWSQIFGNPELRWSDLPWLRELTKLPILVKGVCHPDDARAARAAGLDGLIVSNHGGRQIDGARAALDCLPEVVDASGGLPVLFDSGIRTGSDVIKALALGAAAVLLGRPYVYGLALDGSPGALHALRCLLAELELTVALSGHRSVAGLSRQDLVPCRP
ncbi:MAG TPA: alpha-hydroxy-acid oxidizing protein [Candidatus Dormibacteraeota bacterium]|nr:alpha-hydroxy-acid oxidizing protein [Candidatus Dormibacteraeota bacterium]